MEVETKTTENRIPNILLPKKIWEALTLLCKENKLEWSMIAKFRKDEVGDFVIEDFFIPKQKNTKCATIIDQDAMGDHLADLYEVAADEPTKWTVWIHSHNNMGCFWSPTDYAQMDSFGTDGPDFFLSIVVSTAKTNEFGYCDALGAIAVYKPFKMIIPNVPVLLLDDPEDRTLYEKLQGELNECQTIPAPTYGSGYRSSYTRPSDFTPTPASPIWKHPHQNNRQYPYYDDDEDFYGQGSGGASSWERKNKESALDILIEGEQGGDPRDIKGEAEEMLDEFIQSLLEEAGFENVKSNDKIIASLKNCYDHYWNLISLNKRCQKFFKREYDTTRAGLKARLEGPLTEHSKTLSNLIRIYAGVIPLKDLDGL